MVAALVVDEVGRVRRHQRRFLAVGEQARHGARVGAVADQEAMVAQRPQLATLGACGAACGLERRLDVKPGLGPLALLTHVEALEELAQLVLREPRERQVDVLDRPQVGEHPRQQLLVPRTRDPVEGEVEHAGLLDSEVDEDHRYCLHAQPACGEQALMTADDRLVLAAGDHGLQEAVLAQAARQRLKLGV